MFLWILLADVVGERAVYLDLDSVLESSTECKSARLSEEVESEVVALYSDDACLFGLNIAEYLELALCVAL